MMSFIEKLQKASEDNNSLLCVGLDPDPERMPDISVTEFCQQIIEATSDLVCAYKPNLAFFEALGIDGLATLEKVLRNIPPNSPVIADAKRGDIGNTAKAYARAIFEVLGCDAATVNPYMGHESVQPFTNYKEKGTFILCLTSNAGAADFQHLLCQPDSKPLYETVAQKAQEWNIHNNIGLVVGATRPEPLKRIRELCPEMPFLIPGIGAQGGALEATVRNGTDARGQNAIINVSRQILYASTRQDFAVAARTEALKMRDQINLYRTQYAG